MKTILAGTDFSASSLNACRYAALLSEKLSCKLVIFNLYQTPVYHSNAGLVGISLPAIKSESRDRLDGVVKALQSDFPGLRINGLLSPYALTKELDDFTSRHQVAAVVMGLESKSKISKFIYGTHGVSLGGKIPAPVIIVPDKYKDHRWETVVLAVDNKEKLKKEALKDIEKMVKTAQLRLDFLHVRTPDEVLGPGKSGSLKLGRASVQVSVQPAVSIEAGVQKYCRSKEADMVAIISRKHSVFYNLFNESVTKRVAFASRVPVMALHE